jgi:hypothetical protein
LVFVDFETEVGSNPLRKFLDSIAFFNIFFFYINGTQETNPQTPPNIESKTTQKVPQKTTIFKNTQKNDKFSISNIYPKIYKNILFCWIRWSRGKLKEFFYGKFDQIVFRLTIDFQCLMMRYLIIEMCFLG